MERVDRSLLNVAQLGLQSRTPWLQAGLGLGLLFLVSACGVGDATERERSQAPIVYGADDRREYYELDDPQLRALLDESLVALVPNRGLVAGRGSRVEVLAETWQASSELCEGEPFAEQPGAAFCTGVLLDWDLVLTAGHCARQLAVGDFSVVFDYFYTAPGELELTTEDVFAPAELLAEALDPAYAEPRLDFAWYRLTRPAGSQRRPAMLRLGHSELTESDPIVAIGTGGGVPMKLDAGARVVDARSRQLDYFTADTDTSKGSSGSAAFDRQLGLVGVLSRGAGDFELQPQGCYKTVYSEDTEGSFEQFTYASAAVDALCASGHPSALCDLACDEGCRVPDRLSQPTSLHATGGCSFGTASPLSRSALALLCLASVLAWRRRMTERRPCPRLRERVGRALLRFTRKRQARVPTNPSVRRRRA